MHEPGRAARCALDSQNQTKEMPTGGVATWPHTKDCPDALAFEYSLFGEAIRPTKETNVRSTWRVATTNCQRATSGRNRWHMKYNRNATRLISLGDTYNAKLSNDSRTLDTNDQNRAHLIHDSNGDLAA